MTAGDDGVRYVPFSRECSFPNHNAKVLACFFAVQNGNLEALKELLKFYREEQVFHETEYGVSWSHFVLIPILPHRFYA